LVRPGILTMLQMADKMSYRPAQILGMADRKGFIEPGAAADLTVFDPEKKYVIDPETFVSKGHNTPFGGCEVYGEIRATIVDGEVVYEA
ncbi:MAG: amidohydrolase family protein, partial [Eubacterium sp.]